MKNNTSEEHKQQFNEDIYSLDNVIANFEAIAKRIDNKIANIDSKIANIDSQIANINNKIANLDSQLTKLDFDNKEEHKKIFENLDRIDSRITKRFRYFNNKKKWYAISCNKQS